MVNYVASLKENALSINQELRWFKDILTARLQLHRGEECTYKSIWDIQPPEHTEKNSYYSKFIGYYKSTLAERLLLMLVLAPHVQPQLLDPFYVKNTMFDRGYTEFGG